MPQFTPPQSGGISPLISLALQLKREDQSRGDALQKLQEQQRIALAKDTRVAERAEEKAQTGIKFKLAEKGIDPSGIDFEDPDSAFQQLAAGFREVEGREKVGRTAVTQAGAPGSLAKALASAKTPEEQEQARQLFSSSVENARAVGGRQFTTAFQKSLLPAVGQARSQIAQDKREKVQEDRLIADRGARAAGRKILNISDLLSGRSEQLRQMIRDDRLGTPEAQKLRFEIQALQNAVRGETITVNPDGTMTISRGAGLPGASQLKLLTSIQASDSMTDDLLGLIDKYNKDPSLAGRVGGFRELVQNTGNIFGNITDFIENDLNTRTDLKDSEVANLLNSLGLGDEPSLDEASVFEARLVYAFIKAQRGGAPRSQRELTDNMKRLSITGPGSSERVIRRLSLLWRFFQRKGKEDRANADILGVLVPPKVQLAPDALEKALAGLNAQETMPPRVKSSFDEVNQLLNSGPDSTPGQPAPQGLTP